MRDRREMMRAGTRRKTRSKSLRTRRRAFQQLVGDGIMPCVSERPGGLNRGRFAEARCHACSRNSASPLRNAHFEQRRGANVHCRNAFLATCSA